MNLIEQFLKHPVFAPNDGGGAGDPPPAVGGASPGTEDDPAPAAGGEASSGTVNAPTSSAAWYQSDKLSEDQQTSLAAMGLTVDDPIDAIVRLTEMEAAAQRKLGAKPDQLLHKPKEGQSVADWMSENRAAFGIPDTAEGYEVAKPEGFGDGPDDLKWDTNLEGEARALAHKHGLSGEALQDFTNLQAGAMKALSDQADQKYAQANERMMAELQKDWGGQTDAHISLAKQAVEAFGAKAGLNSEQIAGMAPILAKETGDAGVVKLFAAIGEAMSEDSLTTLPGSGGALTTTPVEARAKLAKMQAPGGEYYVAIEKGDKANIDRLKPEIERLRKISVQS